MVRMGTIIIAILIVIVGITAIMYLSPSEEKRVRKQFDLLSKWVSKDSGETAFTMVSKTQSIATLFAKSCGIRAPVHALSGDYTPEEISGYATRARLEFSKLSLRFYDHDINFVEAGTARVLVTGNLTGRSTGGERVNETREVHCVLKKIEDKWLFSDIEVVEILKK
jgi:hypothetical protein